MASLMNEFQHPDSIWTWSSSSRNARSSLWIPYLQHIEKTKGGWQIAYNGGEFLMKLEKVEALLLYGATGDLPLAFLDDLASHRVVMLVHRRNLPDPYVFVPAARRDDADILSAQIMVRQNQLKCAYVARTLVRARFQASPYPVAEGFYKQLAKMRCVVDVRAMEARQSKQHWQKYFSALGLPHEHRRGKHPVALALDAGSFFLYGVLLRWVLLHRLSPAHGYLHVTTGYPSLVYDLMEPYRYLIEEAVFKVAQRGATDVTAATLSELKLSLDTEVFVPSHRATVRRKNLLHGAVLGLRSWLLGQAPKLVFPTEGARVGGRPPQVGYRLPGADRVFQTGKKKPPAEGHRGASDA
jgi:CRISPR/Cas system-associated endonuclease Cas1